MTDALKMISLKEKGKPSGFLLAFFVLNILVMCIMLYATGGRFLADIVWAGKSPLDGDFLASINRALTRHPYAVREISFEEAFAASYPPFAHFCYYIIGRMIPASIRDSAVTDWYRLASDIVLCLNLCLIVLAAGKYVREKSSVWHAVFILCFVLSHPFAFAVVRAANSTLWVLTFVCLALYLRNSPSPACRELALLFIAFAAGLKISPAVFGLLYLKEGRFREAVRLTVYGIAFSVLPLFFFGGLSAAETYISILRMIGSLTQPRPETIIGVCLEAADVLGLGSGFGLAAGKTVSILYFAAVVALVCFTRLDWKSYTLLSTLMIILMNHSYPYTLIYLLVPVLCFVKETDMHSSKIDYAYAALFVLVLAGYPFLKIDWPGATFITNYFWLYILVFLLLGAKVREALKTLKTCCQGTVPAADS